MLCVRRTKGAACPHALLRGDAPDLVPLELGEPQVAIRPGRDAQWLAAKFSPTGRRQGERSGATTGGDAPDAIEKGQGEPQVAIRPGRDALRPATGRGNGERGEAATGGDAPDRVRSRREPQVAIGPGRDADREAAAQAGAVLRLSRQTQATMAVMSAVKCDRRPKRFMLLPPLSLMENDLRGTNPSRTGQLTVMLTAGSRPRPCCNCGQCGHNEQEGC
jgi:hypothetical protein